MKLFSREIFFIVFPVIILLIVVADNISGQTILPSILNNLELNSTDKPGSAISKTENFPLFFGFSVKDFYLPPPDIKLDPPVLKPDEGSTVTLSIVSKSKWSLECHEAWVSFNLLSGINSARVTVTAQENPGLYARTCKVTVTFDGLTSRIIEIIQKARHEE